MKRVSNIIFCLWLGLGAQYVSLAAQQPANETQTSGALQNTQAREGGTAITGKKMYKSQYVDQALPADSLRTMLLDPEIALAVRENQQLWIGGILRVGLYTRPRAENRQNLNFSARHPESINRTSQNSQIWLFMNPVPDAEIKITIQDARVWGGDGGTKSAAGIDDRAPYFSGADLSNSTSPRSTLDTREAYLQFRNVGITGMGLQIGRQVLSYGDGRMLGGANWNVSGLSFDGVLLKYENAFVSHHLFAVQGSTAAANSAPNGIQSQSAALGNSYMGGSYNTVKLDRILVELYAIGIARNMGVESIANGEHTVSSSVANLQYTNLFTFGTRLTNRTAGNALPAGKKWDYTIEAAFQKGKAPDIIYFDASASQATNNDRSYNGKLFFAQTGYKLLNELRLGAHVYYSPGTKDRTGSQVNTFQSLPGPRFGGYPYLNVFNGISENMGLKNIFSPALHISYQRPTWGTFYVSYFWENKATPEDAWYGISGAPNSSAAARISSEDARNTGLVSLGTNIFHEIDFVWTKTFSDYFSVWVGIGYLHAGDAVRIARANDFNANALMGFIQLTGAL